MGLCSGQHVTSFWDALDPTLAGCISLFDFDPNAVACLIKLRNRLLALTDCATNEEADPDLLFARMSFLISPVNSGHLESHEFRVVSKPLGFSPAEADRVFMYLDYKGGSNRAPPATITVSDIAWLLRLPRIVHIEGVMLEDPGKTGNLTSYQLIATSGRQRSTSGERLRTRMLTAEVSDSVPASAQTNITDASMGCTNCKR